jgi:purine/pyrimidine-nucleoside phosphorylase
MAIPEFSGVTVSAKANVYFDGRVVSHGITLPDGSKKTLGLIHPGEYHFDTQAPERMEIVAGACEVQLDGTTGWKTYEQGARFDVPGNSGFTIRVRRGLTEYVCSFG